MSKDNVKTKTWKTVATFSNYEEASLKKAEILTELLVHDNKAEVKIKRGGQGGNLFRVKLFEEPVKVNKSARKEKQKKLKKKNVK
jgi:hypothetical protein